MKCDSCINKTGYTLGSDECGAGNHHEYCLKEHWEGSGPQSEEEELRQKTLSDPWCDCKDFKQK